MKNLFLLLFAGLLFVSCTTNNKEKAANKGFEGAYLGQQSPGKQAKLFAPEFISTGMYERDAAFSPDGSEFYFTVQLSRAFFAIACTKSIGGFWQEPEIAGFSGKYMDGEPVFHPDGKRLFFASNRVNNTSDNVKDYDIWYVERTANNDWGAPVSIGEPVNSPANEFYPSFTKDGTLYFCANRNGSIGGEDIFCSEYANGKYLDPVNLGESINTLADEYNASVAKDGSYLIYTTHGHGQGVGGGDLFISFKNQKGSWEKPLNFSKEVNSEYFDYCPSISYDGKYLFFTSHRMNENLKYSKMSYKKLQQIYQSPQNGNGDIYWVDISIIEDMKKTKAN